MSVQRKERNIGVSHGRWGEDVAAAYLAAKGYALVARNVHPCLWDGRYELDIVARTPEGTLVFVEVKQTAQRPMYATRLNRITPHKLRLLRIAANAYRRRFARDGGYRFDVIEVYGQPERPGVEIDHIEGVRLFVARDRFVRWC